ncbi:UDP-N-acetylmuramate--L-alanine ligase [Rurimicrobium arvi]|uniref:UDP-N-acetylmuramate--L-alanine ligase n=1 Tax=Rurimicrobium arvi TaxID=2049916 RepID=A0ABP8MIW0_9BACT
MDITKLKRIYFIGIGGIGMSALARFFKERGVIVLGYDLTQTDLTRTLQEEGMQIAFEDEVTLVDRAAELVVYTPAIPTSNKIISWYREHNYPVFKRSDVLQWISESLFAVTVAGTHGKTTISTMTAYLLRETGVGCNAFLGGIAVNYNKNYWSDDNNVAVIEADEYDRSFLKLFPDVAVLTAMDADHLDIYGTKEEVEKAFIQYTHNIKPGGTLIAKHGLHRFADLKADKVISYSLQNDAADVYADNIIQHNGTYSFDVSGPGWRIEGIHLPLGGMHNVENAVAAIAVTQVLQANPESVKRALKEFKGIRRRFEYVVRDTQKVYIDDYAHHPEELASLIRSAKTLFPRLRCVVAFQPHLYSRTRDFAEGFADSLALADEVILLDIYPAREMPIEGVSSKIIAEKIVNCPVTILSKEGLLEYVKAAPLELFITAGAGDIDKLVQPIKELILEK